MLKTIFFISFYVSLTCELGDISIDKSIYLLIMDNPEISISNMKLTLFLVVPEGFRGVLIDIRA